MLGGGNCGMIKGMDSPESSDEDLNKGKLPDLEDQQTMITSNSEEKEMKEETKGDDNIEIKDFSINLE